MIRISENEHSCKMRWMIFPQKNISHLLSAIIGSLLVLFDSWIFFPPPFFRYRNLNYYKNWKSADKYLQSRKLYEKKRRFKMRKCTKEYTNKKRMCEEESTLCSVSKTVDIWAARLKHEWRNIINRDRYYIFADFISLFYRHPHPKDWRNR